MNRETDRNRMAPLKCCQTNDSLTSLSTDENAICEAANVFVKSPMRNNNNRFHLEKVDRAEEKPMFSKKMQVNITFEDVTFSATSWSIPKFRMETKKILHGVSGEFKPGEFSVIMGPSGAGKSTLLNVLAGFVTKGSTGTVKLNGVIRDNNPRFRKLSAYIPQEDEMRLALTVKEAMTFAAHLKLGYNVTNDYKMQKISDVLELLGLDQCLHTLTSRLSGGQRKRLAVALELINNPPILFLDEPTTGLDSSSCSQCVSLCKRLAQDGRTVIATIHQPSALLFEMFDKLYSLAQGRCIYDGTTADLVGYLANLNFQCPAYHNPADYMMELSVGEHNADVKYLADVADSKQTASTNFENSKEKEILSQGELSYMEINLDEDGSAPAAVLMQFYLLYRRNLMTTRRSYSWIVNRLLAHVFIGCLFGYLYRDVGNGANSILANYVYLYGTLLLTVYTGEMPVTLCFPLEMRLLLREYFNRWYKLTPYLLSVILIEIPFQIICVWSYIGVSYWLTNQPMDFRLLLFVLFCTASSLCAQSMGYFIGATTPIKVAVFIAPVIACFLSVFGFCIRFSDTPAFYKPLFEMSYYRAAFQSLVYSVYGFNRPKLYCPEEMEYCHYSDPAKFLKEMDMADVDLVSNISVIIAIWCLMHAATYLTLWIKLNKR